MKFLVDECLSDWLTRDARARGHLEVSHVRRIGKGGAQDWSLLPLILDGDWVLVTKNAYDFRGPVGAPGSRGLYAKTELHAGLVCLNGPPGMDLALQRELFEIAMDELARAPDLTNQVLEVSVTGEHDDPEVVRYALPDDDAPSGNSP